MFECVKSFALFVPVHESPIADSFQVQRECMCCCEGEVQE